jgi:methionyl aminopeptidase
VVFRKRFPSADDVLPAGQFVASVLSALEAAAHPGVNLLELDRIATAMIADAGANSCYVDYHPSFGGSPFGKVLCTSVNDAVLHGLPRDQVLEEGDLLSVDFAVSLHGWVADSALSVVVGAGSEADRRLITATREALEEGIKQAVPGNRVGDISAAIGAVGKDYGYLINTDFGGHGVGRTMHEDPSIPNDGAWGTGPKLVPGMALAIEPWFMHTTDEIFTDEDGWTLRSVDGSRGAHSEHTVVVTTDGPVVVTRRQSENV